MVHTCIGVEVMVHIYQCRGHGTHMYRCRGHGTHIGVEVMDTHVYWCGDHRNTCIGVEVMVHIIMSV